MHYSLYWILLPRVFAEMDQDGLIGVVDLVVCGHVGHLLSRTKVSALEKMRDSVIILKCSMWTMED